MPRKVGKNRTYISDDGSEIITRDALRKMEDDAVTNGWMFFWSNAESQVKVNWNPTEDAFGQANVVTYTLMDQLR